MMNTFLHWNPTGSMQAVEFVEQTQCRYVELYSHPKPLAPERIEGTLDDSSLEEWFNKARHKFIDHFEYKMLTTFC